MPSPTIGPMAADLEPAADGREYTFNKFGTVGKAAGFLIVAVGFMVRSVVRDYDGERTLGGLVSEVTPLGMALFGAVVVGLATILIRAVRRPASKLVVDELDVVFRSDGPVQRIERSSLRAAATYTGRARGFIRKGKPPRYVVLFSEHGANLGPIPKGVNWVSLKPDGPRRNLVDEIMADVVERPDGEGHTWPERERRGRARGGVAHSPAHRIEDLQHRHPGLQAMVVPLQGMPPDTEGELRDQIPNWI